jgi:hypothetical protein
MIAIAAQDRENVASLQSSTYAYLNRGLKDRLFVSSTDSKSEKDVAKGTVEYYKQLYSNTISLIYYVNNYVIPNQNINPQYYSSNVGAMNTYLNTLLVQIERGTDYKAIVPISVEMTVDGLSGFTIGQIFTVNKDVLPRDYENKSVGFIVTGISNDVNTHSWTTTITSQLCLLDQDKRQEESLRNVDAILGELQTAISQNKADNLNSIAYYKVLAALYIDVLRQNIFIKDIEGNVGFKKDKYGSDRILYSKAAVQEVGGIGITFDSLISEFNNTYRRLYPSSTRTTITERTSVNNENRTTTTTRETDTETARIVDVYKNGILENIIKNMVYYTDMKNSDIKSVFDSEMSKVRNGYETNATPPDYTRVFDTGFRVLDYIELAIKNPNTALRAPQELGATFTATYFNAIISTTFNLINSQKAIDSETGAYISSTPLIAGYPYFSEKQ